MDIKYIIHHISTIILIIYYLNFVNKECIMESNNNCKLLVSEFFILSNTNLSTIFYYIKIFHSSIVLDFCFFVSFSYYRGIFVYKYFIEGFESIQFVCNSKSICVSTINKNLFLLSILNIYWYGLLLKKVKKKILRY